MDPMDEESLDPATAASPQLALDECDSRLSPVPVSWADDVDDGAHRDGGPPVRQCSLEEISIEDRPYLVSLHKKLRGHVCAASLVSTTWLLTAAYCLHDGYRVSGPAEYIVVAGITDLTACYNNLEECVKTEGAQVGQPSRFVVHPNYDGNRTLNDLALVRLRRRLNLGVRVNEVDLPANVLDPEEDLRNGTLCTIVGWSRKLITKGYRGPKLLFEMRVSLLDIEDCSDKTERDLDATAFLCTYTENVVGCMGDSGSPLVCRGFQVGVLSSCLNCTRLKPCIYSRIDTHLPWLKQVVASAEPPPKITNEYGCNVNG
ncbi:serine protease 1-like [Schistocerca cancellata]|uniref:serine protease 1-like n=1 Tax=Schistocerca cancellata TaxID=274614 RepID=UPI0021185530|nr:serine protease 1-like [Schistocerca cancellata]